MAVNSGSSTGTAPASRAWSVYSLAVSKHAPLMKVKRSTPEITAVVVRLIKPPRKADWSGWFTLNWTDSWPGRGIVSSQLPAVMMNDSPSRINTSSNKHSIKTFLYWKAQIKTHTWMDLCSHEEHVLLIVFLCYNAAFFFHLNHLEFLLLWWMIPSLDDGNKCSQNGLKLWILVFFHIHTWHTAQPQVWSIKPVLWD